MSNLLKFSQYELYVGKLEHANAVVRYIAQMDDGYAAIRHKTEKDWYVVDVHCTARRHAILLAFIDGLEWQHLGEYQIAPKEF